MIPTAENNEYQWWECKDPSGSNPVGCGAYLEISWEMKMFRKMNGEIFGVAF